MRKFFQINFATVFHVGIVIFAVVLFFLVHQFPLLGTVGFESANFFVVLCAPLFLCAALLNKKPHSYGRTISVELFWLFIFVLIVSALLLINGFYLTSCSQGAGFLSFLIVLVPPLLLNISIGVLVARIIHNRALKFVLFLLGYSAYFSLIIFCWWQNPSFRLITHASLLITSDLLMGDVLSPAVMGFRTATLMLALAIILFGINFLSNQKYRMDGSGFGKVERPILSIWLIIMILFFHVVLHVKNVEAIGKNKKALISDYTLMKESDGIRIFADPLKTPPKSVEAILDEARYYRWDIKNQLVNISDDLITIWLHHSEEDKFLYTGAKNVHFALPKHREIHIAGTSIPHDVLGHELAHVYVGELSKTLIGVPGSGYFIPNLALTEGIAVLLTKQLNLDNHLTIFMQAQALYQADIRVDIEKLFSNNPIFFAMSHPRSSYIYSGAALEYFLSIFPEDERPEKLRRLIKHGNLDVLFVNSDDKSEKIAEFLNSLTKPVPPYAVTWAHRTFPKTSILTSDCSDKTSIVSSDFEQVFLNSDMNQIEKLLSTLPKNQKQLLVEKILDQALERGKYSLALSLIEQSEDLLASQKAQLMLKKAEALINLDRFLDAWAILENIDDKLLDPNAERLVAVSQIFFRDYFLHGENLSVGKAALSYIFSRTQKHQTKLNNFIFRVGQETMKVHKSSPLILISQYLLARVLIRYGEYQDAKNFSQHIMKNPELLPEIIDHENKLMFAKSSMMLRDFNAALGTFKELRTSSTSPAEELFISDQISRIFFEQSRAASPQ